VYPGTAQFFYGYVPHIISNVYDIQILHAHFIGSIGTKVH